MPKTRKFANDCSDDSENNYLIFVTGELNLCKRLLGIPFQKRHVYEIRKKKHKLSAVAYSQTLSTKKTLCHFCELCVQLLTKRLLFFFFNNRNEFRMRLCGISASVVLRGPPAIGALSVAVSRLKSKSADGNAPTRACDAMGLMSSSSSGSRERGRETMEAAWAGSRRDGIATLGEREGGRWPRTIAAR